MASFTLLRWLIVIMRMMGTFPYSVVKEREEAKQRRDTEKARKCFDVPKLGSYKLSPVALVWSLVMMVMTVTSVTLVHISRPDSRVIFGNSKLFGFLKMLMMKTEALVSILTIALSVYSSPRLVHLLNLLQQVCGDVSCPWKPHKDFTFMLLTIVTVLSNFCCSVTMLLAHPHVSQLFEISIYTSIFSWSWMIFKFINKNVIIVMLYSTGHILTSLYSLCSISCSGAVQNGDITSHQNLLSEKNYGLLHQRPGPANESVNSLSRVVDQNTTGGDSEDVRASCEKIHRLNECQRVLNDCFSWTIIMLVGCSSFNVAELVFFLTSGYKSLPHLRVVCMLLTLETLAELGLICLAPGDVLDQMEKLSCAIILRQSRTKSLYLKHQLGHLLKMVQRYPDFNMGQILILGKARMVDIFRFVAMYVVIFHQFWTTEND